MRNRWPLFGGRSPGASHWAPNPGGRGSRIASASTSRSAPAAAHGKKQKNHPDTFSVFDLDNDGSIEGNPPNKDDLNIAENNETNTVGTCGE